MATTRQESRTKHMTPERRIAAVSRVLTDDTARGLAAASSRRISVSGPAFALRPLGALPELPP